LKLCFEKRNQGMISKNFILINYLSHKSLK
jgi:hypothetical protein